MKPVGHTQLLAQLQRCVASGRLPHAQLFSGPQGVGQLPVALWYAASILSHAHPDQRVRAERLEHPDLHLVFPVAPNQKVKKKPISSQFLEEWRAFVREKPYGDLNEWYGYLGIEKKQAKIGVDEAQAIAEQLTLKPFLSDYRVLIIWQADKLNNQAANKLLKLLEEPPKNTVFILIVDSGASLLPTLLSRTQELRFKPLHAATISEALQADGMAAARADLIAAQAAGSYARALQLRDSSLSPLEFQGWFARWIKHVCRAPKQPSALQEFIALADELSALSRERQKQFLRFSMAVFRDALLLNYGLPSLCNAVWESDDFKPDALSPYVHGENIVQLSALLNEAIQHIAQHVSGKLVFLDLSIKITRLLHA